MTGVIIMHKYKVALMKTIWGTYYTTTMDNILPYDPSEDNEFVKWLTEWIEYDVNE